MYQKTFKDARLWGLLGWTILAFIGVVILTIVLFLAFGTEHFSFIRILSDSLLYFLVYKIVLSLMKKQALSVQSVAKSSPKKLSDLIEDKPLDTACRRRGHQLFNLSADSDFLCTRYFQNAYPLP
ncbi:MAG: hypothetical protein U5K84_13020 [Alkalibacterium sp.]|nr:hypothetical protein [Alkalibacterium sp.]